MDTLILIVGLVSSIISIVVFLIEKKISWRTKAIHGVYIFILSFTAYYANSYKHKIDHLNAIARAANTLVADKEMHFTHLGFTLASLAFLERNKADFPDAYARAQELCKQRNCYAGDTDKSDENSAEVSFAMAGLIRGIAAMTDDSEK